MAEPVDGGDGDRRLIRRHDQFAKRLLDHAGNADAFLRERLPPSLVARLSADPAMDRSESLIDPILAELRGDRVYSLATKDGFPVLVWAMVEHKSSPTTDFLLQTMGYLHGLAAGGAQRRVNADGTVWIVPAPVFAIVLYHGVDRWTLPPTLGAAYGLPEEMLRAGPLDFGYTLVDLANLPDAGLSGHAELQAGLLMLKYATRDDDPEVTLECLLGAAATIDLSIVRIVVRYLFGSGDAGHRNRLRSVLGRILPGQEDDIMPTIAESYIAEGEVKGHAKGMAEGLAEGLAEGELKGRAALFIRILEQRFGEVPDAVDLKVRTATIADIDRWIGRILEASSPEAVINDPAH
ncbi:hypothetical protein N825_15660 [Skermanella stibiiresistens SB22]|uniref:Transposase (putative) YhgA-like domain-containing protein n=1 Tax=Skermanella stibiiresistens SB22 TaxID=1385369 RepID=W9GW05_9PROT|nr:Rpn family recombination-promoting nuclease/putative transposase [Skermanella stibiiresistens]EWY38095.1 hypothetical protein N825_15660 [Skermanella stibiiresistens SB22]